MYNMLKRGWKEVREKNVIEKERKRKREKEKEKGGEVERD